MQQPGHPPFPSDGPNLDRVIGTVSTERLDLLTRPRLINDMSITWLALAQDGPKTRFNRRVGEPNFADQEKETISQPPHQRAWCSSEPRTSREIKLVLLRREGG